MTTAVQKSSDRQGHFPFSGELSNDLKVNQSSEAPKSFALMTRRIKIVLISIKPFPSEYKSDPDFICSLPFF
jgi:hypothetical protein